MNRIIYFGPPGTGKTTTLLDSLKSELSRVPVDEIAFLTFTRRARYEAVERVGQVLGIKAKDLPYFRTVHSMAFRALRLKEGDVLGKAAMDEFGKTMGLTFGQVGLTEMAGEGVASGNAGDVMLALDNLARIKIQPLQKVWNEAKPDVDWPTVDQFSRSYSAFKLAKGLMDFTDVLTEFVKAKVTLPVSVCFIDEAQDLSSLQWLAVFQATAEAERQYIAGDDDQAIYRWAGADVKTFMSLEGQRIVLQQSYRLPRSVFNVAARISAQIKKRVPKVYQPRDEDGLYVRHATVNGLDATKGGWLWLVRNRCFIPQLQHHLEQVGVVYSMHGRSSVIESERDAIYGWEKLRKGGSITGQTARIVYKQLRSKKHIKIGHKLLPSVGDQQAVTLALLKSDHGLLTDAPWFEVMDGIPMTRRIYYRRLLRHSGSLKLPVSVQLETIHGAKGSEAERVALFLDMSRRTYEEQSLSPDDEHRVWYVGATRAKAELHVIEASGRYSYAMRV